jgi:hypothetical protein
VHLEYSIREENHSSLRPSGKDSDPAIYSRVNEYFDRISPLKVRNAECSRRLFQEPKHKGC